MKSLWIALLLLGLPLAAMSQDPQPVKGITFPASAAANPATPPAATPATQTEIPVLTAEQIYVVQSDANFFLLASPPDLAKVSTFTGPLLILNKVADNTEPQPQTYTGRFIKTVTVKKGAKGRLELIAIPAEPTDEKGILRRILQIGGKTDATTTPATDGQPPVKPNPTEPILSGPIRVIFVSKSTVAPTLMQNTILKAEEIHEYLKTKCTKESDGEPDLRFFKDGMEAAASESKGIRDLWAAAQGQIKQYPAIIIGIGDDARAYNLPESVDKTMEFLKEKLEKVTE